MKLDQIEPILHREPFRPFAIRMSSGEVYEVLEPRNLGAPKQVTHTLVFFGEDFWALIDVENITEIVNP